MIHFMSQNQREATTLPVERHSEHLSSIYGTQTLEINGAIISQNQNCVIVRGMFQQQKVKPTADVTLWEKNSVPARIRRLVNSPRCAEGIAISVCVLESLMGQVILRSSFILIPHG